MMKSKKLDPEFTNHIVGKVSGVKPTDTRVEAARKVIETMKLAGFPKRAIAEAEQMLEDAIARGVK